MSDRKTEGDEFTIGRDASNDIVVEDSSVSRCHAALRLGESEIVLIDLESLNGTHVREDGRWIEIARATVKPQEPILLGEVVITPDSLLNRVGVRHTDRPSRSQPVRRSIPAGASRNKAIRKQGAHAPPTPNQHNGHQKLKMDAAAPTTPGDPANAREAVEALISPAVPVDGATTKDGAAAPMVQISEKSGLKIGKTPRADQKRRRMMIAAIVALVLVSTGIGAVGWALAEPATGLFSAKTTSKR